MSRTIKFYYDLLSQPSRALYIFLKMTKIPHEDCPVALMKGEHLTDEYRDNINRFQKVPCIIDNDFKLAESVAIFRYLFNEYQNQYKIPEYWYPKETKQRALVDEYLEWQHLNIRKACSYYFILKWVRPRRIGKEPKEFQLTNSKLEMDKCLDLMENEWLQSKNFIVGKTITIADLLAACEIEQPRVVGYDPFEGRPKLRAWLDLVKKTTNPYYDEAHIVLNKLRDSENQNQSSKL